MTTLAEIEAAATALKPEEREHLETLLREQRERENDAHLEELYQRTGFRPLPKRPGDKPVTTEIVRQICDEEGI